MAGVEALTLTFERVPFAAAYSTRALSPLGAQALSAAFFFEMTPTTTIEPSTPRPSARQERSSIVRPSTVIEPTCMFAPAGPLDADAEADAVADATAVAVGAAVAVAVGAAVMTEGDVG